MVTMAGNDWSLSLSPVAGDASMIVAELSVGVLTSDRVGRLLMGADCRLLSLVAGAFPSGPWRFPWV